MKRALKVHLPLALLSGLIAFLIFNFAAWYNLRDFRNVCRNQGWTRITLYIAADDIEDYRKEHKRLPENLSEVAKDSKDTLMDRWENPIQYEVSGDEFTVFSFGRDGQPGGIGLDADLYHDDRNREQSLPTLRQFFFTEDSSEVESGGFVLGGLFIGGMVAFTVFKSHWDLEKRVKEPSPWLYVVSVVVTFVLSSVIGFFLLIVEIPSGH